MPTIIISSTPDPLNQPVLPQFDAVQDAVQDAAPTPTPASGIKPDQQLRPKESKPIEPPRKHDQELGKLVRDFHNLKSGPALGDEQKTIMEKIYNYPYEGTTLGKYFRTKLRDQAKKTDNAEINGKMSNFPQTDSTMADVFEMIRQALSSKNAAEIENLPGYLSKLVQYYGKPPRRTGQERAEYKMKKYVDWFNNPDQTNGRVEGAEEARKAGDWEEFKKLAWEQYKRDEWKDSNGEQYDIAKSVAWIMSEVEKNRETLFADSSGWIRQLWSVPGDMTPGYEFAATIRKYLVANVTARCAKAGKQMPSLNTDADIFRFLSENKLPDPTSLQLPKSLAEMVTELKKLLEKNSLVSPRKMDNKTMEAKFLNKDKVEETFPLASLEMLNPGKQNLGPRYFDKIRGGTARPKITTIDEGRTRKDDDLGDDNAHRLKHDDNMDRTDALQVSSPGETGFSNPATPTRPKPPTAPVAPAKTMPTEYFDFAGTDDEKKKASERQGLVSPGSPNYKQVMEGIANGAFDPASEKLLHDAAMMISNVVPEEVGGTPQERVEARKNNSRLKSQFVRDHETELSALPGEDNKSKLLQLNIEVWKRVMKYISDDANYAALQGQHGEPVAVAMRSLSRIMLFAARTELLR